MTENYIDQRLKEFGDLPSAQATPSANPEGLPCPSPGTVTIAPNGPMFLTEEVTQAKFDQILALLNESKRRLDELHDKIDKVLENN